MWSEPVTLGGGMTSEKTSAEVFLLLAFLGELALHHHLGGDAGVVEAGQPEGVEAAHALPAHDHVLEGEGEGVSDVQGSRDVGGRDHDRKARLARRGIGDEEAALLPEGIPARFDVFRFVGVGEFFGGHRPVSVRCSLLLVLGGSFLAY